MTTPSSALCPFRKGFSALESVVMMLILVVFTMVVLSIIRLEIGWPPLPDHGAKPPAEKEAASDPAPGPGAPKR